jgi:hypothetical protein
MNRLTVPTVAAATAIAVAAAGCGSSHSSASNTTTAAAASAATAPTGAPPALLGTYTRSVSKADIARTRKIRDEAGPNQQSPKPAVAKMIIGQGTITITITTAGLRVTQDSSATAAGGLEIKGYRNPQVGAFCGPDIPQNATYTWKQSGAGLTLHARADKCADRDSTMTGTWKKR